MSSSQYVADLFSVDGKICIVTGGTGGLGLAMSTALAKAGCDIVSIQLPNDPNGEGLKKAVEGAGKKFTAFEADVGVSKQLREAFAKIWAAGITPDILLNCAGILRRGPIESMTDDDIDDVLAINLRATYIAAQEFGAHLVRLGRPGKIINIGSICSFIGTVNVSVYTTTKGGILQMTKGLSCEWASKGIQVNAICPGYTKTPMTAASRQNPEYERYIIDRIPAGRWALPEDYQGTVIFLASQASNYVTGTTIVCDGGLLGR